MLSSVYRKEEDEVGGRLNIADALTKEAGTESIAMHVEGSSLKYKVGRHELAPAIEEDNITSIYNEC